MGSDHEHGLDELELIALTLAQKATEAGALVARRRQLIVDLLRSGVPYARIRARVERTECGYPCTDRRRRQLEARLRKETERYRNRRTP